MILTVERRMISVRAPDAWAHDDYTTTVWEHDTDTGITKINGFVPEGYVAGLLYPKIDDRSVPIEEFGAVMLEENVRWTRQSIVEAIDRRKEDGEWTRIER